MPFPLNFVDREFASETRAPAAHLARALADLHEAFARIEERNPTGAQKQLREGSKKLASASREMQRLKDVEDRWEIRDPHAFPEIHSRLSALLGFAPTGDRQVIDHLTAETTALKSVVDQYASQSKSAQVSTKMPSTPEGQFYMIREILERIIRLMEIGMLATQLSTVTGGRKH